MFKFILRLFASVAAILAALIGISYFQEKRSPKYIDIYSDKDEEEEDIDIY